jgi:hypothetical protein
MFYVFFCFLITLNNIPFHVVVHNHPVIRQQVTCADEKYPEKNLSHDALKMNSGPSNRRHISSKIPFQWRIRLYFYFFYLIFDYRHAANSSTA